MVSEKFIKAQEEAKRYVKEHNVEGFITEMLNRMVQTRPQDPKVFMLQFIVESSTPGQLEAARIAKTADGERVFVSFSQPASDETPANWKQDSRPSLFSADMAAGGPVHVPEELDAEWAAVGDWNAFQQTAETKDIPVRCSGGVRWLAGHIVSGTAETVVERLQWLAEHCGACLFEVDDHGVNLAMAICQHAGLGPWKEWLTDKGICSSKAVDDQGRSVEDYAQMYQKEHAGDTQQT